MARSYKPGYRNRPDYDNKPGLFTKGRWAWVKVYFGELIIWGEYKKDAEGNDTDEVLDIKLVHPIPNRQPAVWNLTALTEEELVSFQHLFNTAVEYARPICKARDKEAQDALEAGDDSFARVYRSVPQLVYRTRPESEHGEGVQHGPEDAAGVHGDGDDQPGGLRVQGADMAERDSSDSRAQDDGKEVDEPSSIRQVGEHRDGPE